eukprot:CAMPEP_0118717002 /NCGR_PEP_ID=MMETSP0800-20121206/27856_1 /TAXON_ID=210618 ORGANISM="Striatella unipunctata, Strain CCMP2910" /NCGR_SAMPLE_ID=MMETSP0800 /ASSEMBLY_ACC=CAM_ASM_000638 /LENGTH=142 /DNA_ID=CAMNT_0006623569 /DNA_START=103 /DNA_END=531 /DNA_ORIENTATION=-
MIVRLVSSLTVFILMVMGTHHTTLGRTEEDCYYAGGGGRGAHSYSSSSSTGGSSSSSHTFTSSSSSSSSTSGGWSSSSTSSSSSSSHPFGTRGPNTATVTINGKNVPLPPPKPGSTGRSVSTFTNDKGESIVIVDGQRIHVP